MAATWIILGYQGVVQYQLLREKVLGNLLKSIGQDDHPLLVSQRLTASAKPEKLDCFHNGTDVLSEVSDWHTFLRKSTRKADPITDEVLHLIDKEMLIQDPEKRRKSGDLCKDLERIVSSAKKVLRDAVAAESPEIQDRRSHFEGLLYDIDKEATVRIVDDVPPPEPTHPFTAGLPVDRVALKAQLEHVALKKTSHRYEAIPGPRSTSNVPETIMEKPAIKTSDTMGTKEILYRSESLPESSAMSMADKRKSFRRPTLGQASRTNTSATNQTTQRYSNEGSTHASQNAIQARESMDREKRKNMLSRRLRKDGYLSKFFKERDIVSFLRLAISINRIALTNPTEIPHG